MMMLMVLMLPLTTSCSKDNDDAHDADLIA